MITEYHEAANIFPLDEDRIPELAEDIKENGLINPIQRCGGKIIDGRRRHLACVKAEVKHVYNLKSRSDRKIPLRFLADKVMLSRRVAKVNNA